MPTPNPAALEFLLSRRSRPAKTLTTPVPSREALLPLLTAAARTPDHGKLEPWRFVVLERPALARLGQIARQRAQDLGYDAEKADKGANQFETGTLAVAVIEVQRDSAKIPPLEMT
jgi:nitroreductase